MPKESPVEKPKQDSAVKRTQNLSPETPLAKAEEPEPSVKAEPTPTPATKTHTESKEPKPLSRKRNTKSSAFSIANTLAGTKLEEKEEANFDEAKALAPQTNKARDAFSQEQLTNFYKAFVEDLKKENKPRTLAILDHKTPTLKSAETAVLTFENNTQENIYLEVRLQLLQFLRVKLNNFHLTLETVVIESSKETLPYSPQEMYNDLLKKNENMAVLKQQLNLDIK